MATSEREFIVGADGVKKAVILPLEEYEQLIEDVHDLAAIEDWPTIHRRQVALSWPALRADIGCGSERSG